MNILLLCTGNTCRSPMAEGLLNKKIKERRLSGITVRSCGANAVGGERANPRAIKVAAEMGVDLNGFTATPFTKKLLDWADVVLCMTPALTEAVKSKKATDFSLLYGIKPISDPYGGSDEDYRKTIYDLNFACELLVKELEKGHK